MQKTSLLQDPCDKEDKPDYKKFLAQVKKAVALLPACMKLVESCDTATKLKFITCNADFKVIQEALQVPHLGHYHYDHDSKSGNKERVEYFIELEPFYTQLQNFTHKIKERYNALKAEDHLKAAKVVKDSMAMFKDKQIVTTRLIQITRRGSIEVVEDGGEGDLDGAKYFMKGTEGTVISITVNHPTYDPSSCPTDDKIKGIARVFFPTNGSIGIIVPLSKEAIKIK